MKSLSLRSLSAIDRVQHANAKCDHRVFSWKKSRWNTIILNTYFMYSFTYFNPRYLKFRISVSTKNWRYPKFMKVFSLDETATAVHDKNVHNWKLKFVYTLFFFFFSTSYFYRHYVSSEPCGARDILNTLFLQCCEINFIK